jgi:hypothetical protein
MDLRPQRQRRTATGPSGEGQRVRTAVAGPWPGAISAMGIERRRAVPHPLATPKLTPIRYFGATPEIVRWAAMMCIRLPRFLRRTRCKSARPTSALKRAVFGGVGSLPGPAGWVRVYLDRDWHQGAKAPL